MSSPQRVASDSIPADELTSESTPDHDVLMLWLDRNVESCLPKHEWSTEYISECKSDLACRIALQTQQMSHALEQEHRRVSLLSHPLSRVGRERHQETVAHYEKRLQTLRAFDIEKTVIPQSSIQIVSKRWAQPVFTRNVVGFIDLLVSRREPHELYWNEACESFGIRYRERDYAFQVRPVIQSAVDTIRHIRIYESEMRSVQFILVSPDNRFASLFEEQKIWFLKCPEVNEVASGMMKSMTSGASLT